MFGSRASRQNYQDNYTNMYCRSQGHQRQKIQYVCQSPSCNFLPLCVKCKKKHDSKHSLIRFEIALQKAVANVNLQMKKLAQYITPIQKKQQALKQVQKQIDQLKQDKRRLMRKIQEQIEKQIKKLQSQNCYIKEDEQKFYDQLTKKMQSLKQMKQRAGKQPDIFRDSLILQIEPYLYKFGKVNKYLTSRDYDSNFAHLYVKTSHQMIISQLQMKKQILNPKLLKKVYNESPLYFLIDPKYQTSRYLHYFVPNIEQSYENSTLQLRIYDVERSKWNKIINREYSQFMFTEDFSTLYDHNSQRFYYIAGRTISRRRSMLSNQIVWYDLNKNGWQKSKINIPRYNCMSALIYKKGKKQNQMHYVLIAGGINQEQKAIKSWQLFDPNLNKVIYMGQMNFASAGGKLVNFEGDIVFRIGGYANKSQRQYAVCPIVQKCDFSVLNNSELRLERDHKFNFSYIQVQDVSKQIVDPSSIKYQLYYVGQGAIQINPNEIFIFGGRLCNGTQVSQTYILNVQRFQVQNYKKQKVLTNRYYARWINQKPLISEKHFQNQTHCIWKGKLYSLQNLAHQKDFRYKGLIQFDMKSWYQTQNIVDDAV